MLTAEVGCCRILPELDDAATDRAGAREVIEQRIPIAAADGACQFGKILVEGASISSTASLLARNTSRHIVGSDAAMRVKSAKAACRKLHHFRTRDLLQFIRCADDGVSDQVR